MKFKIHKLTNYHFISSVDIVDLINEISKTYKRSMVEISKEYAPENIPEEYCEYIISSTSMEKIFLDNLVLFTKEKFEGNDSEINVDKFVVGDGFSKIITINNLLITKDFILKRVDSLNISVFKELYKDLFILQTGLPLYYFNAVLAIFKSKFKGDVRDFAMNFLNNKIHVNIVTETNEDFITEYIVHKNMINKMYTCESLKNKINLKLEPYSGIDK